jgi:hypothetical protein
MKRHKPRTRRARELARRQKNDARLRKLSAVPSSPDGAALPSDIDAFRNALARRLTMIIGNRRSAWRDCPESSCRRTRGCMAPRIKCSNAPPGKPDPDGTRLARTLAQVRRALEAGMATAPAEEIAQQGKKRGAGEK